MMDINPLYIAQYLDKHLPDRSETLLRLEKEASEDYIPNITRASIQLIRVLLQAAKPRYILEVGTAIGYSAIHMAEAVPDAQIITLEKDIERAKRAQSNFVTAGVESRVELIVGDAEQIIPELEYDFDAVFIDAAKGQYIQFMQAAMDKLKPGGLMISDNVLFRGMVAQSLDEVERRYSNMLLKLQNYNQVICEHPFLDTSIVPIGDGLAISYKKR